MFLINQGLHIAQKLVDRKGNNELELGYRKGIFTFVRLGKNQQVQQLLILSDTEFLVLLSKVTSLFHFIT